MTERPKAIGKRKDFDQELSDRYDTPARLRIKEVLGDMIRDNPDKTGADMLINCKGCRFKYLELQICANWWQGHRFPHPRVYIFARKIHYGPDTLFLVMNRDMSEGYLFSIGKEDYEQLRKRRLRKWSREWVYELPWRMCCRCTVGDLDEMTLQML